MGAMRDSQGSMLGLVVSPVLWGGNFLVGDMLADTLPGVWANLLRWVIALIVLAPFCAGAVWSHRKVLAQHIKPIAVCALLGVTLFNTLLYMALRLAPVNLAAITFALAPFMILAISSVARHRLPAPREIAAASVAIVGMMLLQQNALREGVPFLGLALCVMAAACWAGYCMAVQRLAVPAPAGAVYYTQIVIGSILLAPLALLYGPPDLAAMGSFDWLCLGYLGVFAGAIAFWLWQGAICRVGAEKAGIFMNIVPLTSIVVGTFTAGVHLTSVDILCCAMILVAVSLSRPKTVLPPSPNKCLTT
ncbi:hypothetical protein A8B82_08420 [Sulfitobacter sp. EhC04]|nr:hypothetical protein A8B82_08420 [Sulfitobacter sp. EhC04]